MGTFNVRDNDKSEEERGRAIDHLRDFLNVNYVPATEVARSLNVRPERVYSWLSGKSRPSHPERITAFLDALPSEPGSGLTPTGYQYRESKNWKGILKPRRCPFCKRAKGEVQKVRGGFQGACRKCGATGPKQADRVAALLAWNGRVKDFNFASDQLLDFRPRKRSASKAPQRFKIRRKKSDREPRELTGASRKTRTVAR
jgi:hypothetical protein